MRWALYGFIIAGCVIGGIWITQPATSSTPPPETAAPIGTVAEQPDQPADTRPQPVGTPSPTTTLDSATAPAVDAGPSTTSPAGDDTIDQIDIEGDVVGDPLNNTTTSDGGDSTSEGDSDGGVDAQAVQIAAGQQVAVEFALGANSDSFDTDPDQRVAYLDTLATPDVVAAYSGLSLEERSRFVVRTASLGAAPVTTVTSDGIVVDVDVDVTDWADNIEAGTRTIAMRVTVVNGVVVAVSEL